ncbi:MAG: phosphodiesterase [Rhodospirillaceae bacterium]|nr:phosphodiesterase [Rhodospirillaceae bacterium]|tara:strand:+ start:1029 stop:1811 length:783 start_codon:yes stop_codon:yes gene_type:complete
MIKKEKIKKSYTLLQITDLHLQASPKSQMRGLLTQSTFEAVLDHAKLNLHWPPDGILVTGDIVQDGSRAGYDRFKKTFHAYDIPILCIPGNHDDPIIMRELLDEPPFQFCGKVKFGKWQILLLSTFQDGKHAGAIDRVSLEALKKSLENPANEHVVICMHHQPLQMGSAWLDCIGLENSEQFTEIINKHESVRAVLWGHVHQASEQRINGVRWLSTPSTCSQFLPNSESFALDNQPPGMRWIKLGEMGQIKTYVEWITYF